MKLTKEAVSVTTRAPARVAGLPLALAALVAGMATLSACAEKLSSATASCPCATGNVCCSSGVCAADESACPAATLALAQESVGTWKGYIENFTFASGSDAISIALAVSGQDVSGQVVFGGTELVTADAGGNGGAGVVDGPPTIGEAGVDYGREYREGFAYQATNIRWENRRLKLAVSLADGWVDLCASFLPITVRGYTFICPNGWGYSFDRGECTLNDGLPIDCDLLARCGGQDALHCACTETMCTPQGSNVDLDVALQGRNGDGSEIGIGGGSPYNVRLTRTSM